MEHGAASSILALNEHAGVPLAHEQKELTPFQRMVVQLEAKRQHDKAQEEQNQPGGASAPTRNTKAMPNSNSALQGETVTYVNEGAE